MTQESTQRQIHTQAKKGGNGNGDGNGGDQSILDQLTLNSFTATPSTVTVGTSESVTLDWDVTEPAIPRARNIRFTLATGAGSFPVGPVGSQSVQVSIPMTISLIASLGSASQDLGDVSITSIPNPACKTILLTSELILPILTPALKKAIASYNNKVKLKSDPDPREWPIDSSGIHGVLHLTVPTPVGIDIDVDVSITLIPVLSGGQLTLTYSNFHVDIHFPWWVNIFAPGVTTIVEQIADSIITGQLKPQIPGLLQKAIRDLMLPTGIGTIAQIQLQQGQIVATACPS